MTDRKTAISGPYSPEPYPGCRVFVWEQAGVPEGNSEGRPVGNRTLVHRRTGTTCLLVEWARGDRKINHRTDGGRDNLRRREPRSELLLLARLRRAEQPSGNLSYTRFPTRLQISAFSEGATPDLESVPGCWTGISLLTDGDAHRWSTQSRQHFHSDCH